jgi:glutamate formiminotransferase/formiminotetrahydrofolate cyclodeaminase
VLALIRDEAARYGAAISGCEVVGLVPEYALLDAAEHALQLENFRRDQVLELRLRHPPLSEAVTVAGWFDAVAAGTPTPGGGSVAAFVGALASCLAVMVANLTLGKKKYAASEAEMRAVKTEAEGLRRELLALARADNQAFDAVLAAGRLPHTSAAEIAAREAASAAAMLEAARVPLRTAEACLRVVEFAGRAAKSGNRNAVTDAGVAGLLAHAAGRGALLNVQINLKSLPPGADKHGVETHLQRLDEALRMASEDCLATVNSTLNAS